MLFREFFSLYDQDKYFDDAEVISFYVHHTNMPVTEIAEICKRSIPEIYRILRVNSVMPNRMCVNHQSVYDCHEAGYTPDQISKVTGYSANYIRKIINKNKEPFGDN